MGGNPRLQEGSSWARRRKKSDAQLSPRLGLEHQPIEWCLPHSQWLFAIQLTQSTSSLIQSPGLWTWDDFWSGQVDSHREAEWAGSEWERGNQWGTLAMVARMLKDAESFSGVNHWASQSSKMDAQYANRQKTRAEACKNKCYTSLSIKTQNPMCYSFYFLHWRRYRKPTLQLYGPVTHGAVTWVGGWDHTVLSI